MEGLLPSRNKPGRYAFQPCPTSRGEVRLFRIEEIDPSSTVEEIKCRLEHFDLNEPPEFTALSYECGGEAEKQTIRVNRHTLSIPRNLVHAIRQVVLEETGSHKDGWLWADAICIDQYNMEEKSDTVSRLHDIYSAANAVAACVGGSENRGESVIDCVDYLAQERHVMDAQQRQAIPDDIKGSLIAFCDRSYFSRTWILQELILGTQVTVYCGSRSLDWAPFDELIEAFSSKFSVALTASTRLRYLQEIRRGYWAGRTPGLLELLRLSSGTRTTVPHDKVFALLGLAIDSNTFLAMPSYEVAPRTLCLNMATRWIRSRKSLDIMLAAVCSHDHKNKYGLPSWCPKFLDFGWCTCLRKITNYISGQPSIGYSINGARWRTTTHSPARLQDGKLVSNRYLAVRTYCLGKIVSLGYFHHSHPDGADWAHYTCRTQQCPVESTDDNSENDLQDQDLIASIESVSKTIEGLFNLDFKASTCRGGKSILTLFGSDTWSEKLRKRYPSLSSWCNGNSDFCVDTVAGVFKLKDLAREMGRATLHQEDLEFYGATTSQVVKNSGLRLMNTSGGKLGWAHHRAHLGDEVHLIAGCSMPVILSRSRERPSAGGPDNVTRFVGPAMLTGVMDGEVWRDLRSEDLTEILLK